MITLVNEVQSLEKWQFKDREDIYEVVISGVDEIPPGCFYDCKNLRKVTIRGELPTVSFCAFEGCVALEEVIVEGDCGSVHGGTSMLGARSGHSAKGIKIDWYAFAECASLRRIDHLEKASAIETKAFKGCVSLKTIRLGSMLEDLAKSAFLGCDLSGLSIDNNPIYRLEDGFLIERKGPYNRLGEADCRVLYQIGSSSSPRLPRGATLLSDLCFNDSHITELSLPPAFLSLDDVGYAADEVVISEIGAVGDELYGVPSSSTKLYYDHFRTCSKLERFRLQKGNSGLSVAKGVLFSKDRKVLLRVPPAWPGPGPVENPSEACNSLVYVVPEGTTEIAHHAFSGCRTVTDVVLPSTLETIGFGAFADSSVVRVTVASGNRSFFSDGPLLYMKNVFDHPEEPKTVLMFCNRDVRDADVSISPDVTAIFPHAFGNCRQLTHVELPDRIQDISDSAFQGCCSLEEMHIPAGAMGIEPNAFEGCTALRLLSLPDGGQFIGESFLKGCSQDIEIYLPSDRILASDDMYEGCDCNITFSLGPGCDEVSNIDVFFYDHIVGYKVTESPCAGSSSKVEGAMPKDSCCVERDDDAPNKFIVDESGAVIANGYEPGSVSLVRVPSDLEIYDIPQRCDHIASCAFLDCSKLESLYIPDNVKYIDHFAIHSCRRLRVIRYPEHAFCVERNFEDDGISSIEPLSVENVLEIDYQCKALSEVIIGQKKYSVEEIIELCDLE